MPTRDGTVAASSSNYRNSTNVQVLVHADTRLVLAVGEPQPANRNDCVAYRASGVDQRTRRAHVIADGGHRATSCRSRIDGAVGRPNCPGERKSRLLSTQSLRPRRACVRPHKEREDPPGLPPPQRRPAGSLRHRTPGQPRRHRVTLNGANSRTNHISVSCKAASSPLADRRVGGRPLLAGPQL